jgi:hypothetical protein
VTFVRYLHLLAMSFFVGGPLLRAVAQGRVPTVALGRYHRFRQEAITRWIEQLEAGSRRATA